MCARCSDFPLSLSLSFFLKGEHDWWAKVVTPFFNEIAHIPFWIHDPRHPEAGGTTSDALCTTIDLPPTLLEYFKVGVPGDMQGVGLRARLRDVVLGGVVGDRGRRRRREEGRGGGTGGAGDAGRAGGVGGKGGADSAGGKGGAGIKERDGTVSRIGGEEDVDVGDDGGDYVGDYVDARPALIYGVHGGQVNVTDGRYVYMRGAANNDNTPLFEYTLMPTHMRSRFHPAELRKWERHDGFTFTKRARVMQIKARTHRFFTDKETGPIARGRMATLLFDLELDPGMEAPLDAVDVEARMIRLMLYEMALNDSPPEQYTRLGLPMPSVTPLCGVPGGPPSSNTRAPHRKAAATTSTITATATATTTAAGSATATATTATAATTTTARAASAASVTIVLPPDEAIRTACRLGTEAGVGDAVHGGAGAPGATPFMPGTRFPENLRLRPGYAFGPAASKL